MSIIARCECGNRMAVADVMAGRTLRCSKCGGEVLVPDASAATPTVRKKGPATPAIEISPTLLMGGVLAMIVIVVFCALYFGPWAVGRQWAAMSSSANDQVTDVVDFAIKAYESRSGMYDASIVHNEPHTEGPCVFVAPMMAFSMPRRIIFSGKTNQGSYIGTYDTSSGEIITDIQTGGYDVGGLLDIKKPTGNFHITGREKDGKVAAEINGSPLTILSPKPIGRGE